jgi:cytochrome c553
MRPRAWMRLSAAVAAGWVGAFPGMPAAVAETPEHTAALEAVPDLRNGERIYGLCTSCHSADVAPSGLLPVPRIEGQHARVLIKQLIDYRNARRWDPRMEQVAEPHVIGGPQDIADVAAYVSTLQPAGSPMRGPGTDVQQGKKLYRAQCAGCHGALGEGNPTSAIPRLDGQHYDYLLRQVYDVVEGRRPNMTVEHRTLLAQLERADISAIVDYLSRLSRKSKDQGRGG